jgi:hydroxyacylglutathione hydrolase
VNRSPIQIATVVSALFEEVCYVAHLGGRQDCLVIDPGLEPRRVIEHLQQNRLTPAAILNTHGHSDHIGGNAALKLRWAECPLVIGRIEAPKLTDPELNLSAGFGLPLVSPPADVTVDDGDVYSAAWFDLHVRLIPGHSAGHVVYPSRM